VFEKIKIKKLFAVFCSMSYLQNHKDRSYTLKYNYEEASSGLSTTFGKDYAKKC